MRRTYTNLGIDSGELRSYREGEKEQRRSKDLLRLVPKGLCSVLDIGARDGYYSKLLTDYFDQVTALDLELPTFKINNVLNVHGDARDLNFPDNSFDCVFCSEVLEHIVEVEKAAHEISRVAKKYIVIGVPYKQDIRIGRATCLRCGNVNPPWGHVNVFDEKRLGYLFQDLELIETSFVGTNMQRTNALSTWLMDLGGNPWGAPGQQGPYTQVEPCIYCGAKFFLKSNRTLSQKVFSGLAHRINLIQGAFVKPNPNWIHVLFRKSGTKNKEHAITLIRALK